MSEAPVVWFLRSLSDRDTHRGVLNVTKGTVSSPCGVTFTPRVLPFGRGLGFTGDPPDPGQVCPACAKASR